VIVRGFQEEDGHRLRIKKMAVVLVFRANVAVRTMNLVCFATYFESKLNFSSTHENIGKQVQIHFDFSFSFQKKFPSYILGSTYILV